MPDAETTPEAAVRRPDGVTPRAAEVLPLSADRLADIIDFLPDATMVVDRAGTVIAWNRAMEDLTGCPAGDMIGRGGRAYAVPFYGERRPMLVDVALGDRDAEALYPELQRDGDTVMADVVHRQADDSVAYQWAKARPLRDAGGAVVGAIETVRDVTDQRRAEQALRDREARYRLLAENQRDVVLALAPDGVLTYCSPAMREFGGYEPDEVVGTSATDYMVTDEDRRGVADSIARVVVTQKPASVEFLFRPKHGDPFPAEATGNPIVEAGRVVSIQSVLRDVTERRQAEEKVRDLAKFPAENPGPVLRIARGGAVRYANEAGRRLLDGLGGGPDSPAPPAWRDEVGRAFADAQVRRTEVRHGDRTYALRFVPVDGADYANVYGEDTTERKRLEHELRRLAMIAEQAAEGIAWADLDGNLQFVNDAWARMHGYASGAELVGRRLSIFHTDEQMRKDVLPFNEGVKHRGQNTGEIGHKRKDGTAFPTQMIVALLKDERGEPYGLAAIAQDITERKRTDRALADQKAALERSNAELQEFAYVASHDLQEPLRMVASYVQLLEKRYADALDDDAREFIGYAVDGARRMQALINDLLTYSRVGTRAKPFAAVEAKTLLTDALSNLEVAVRETGAEVTHGPLPRVVGDAAQLTRVFQNLIGNALKFCDGAPRVHVSAERDGGAWRFAVRDNGIGIDPDRRDRIFVIFQRLHRREAYPGTGMGLAITRKIVERHGGRVWVKAASGGGSIFSFTIPDRKEPADDPPNPDTIADADAGQAGRDPAGGRQPRRHPAHAGGPARG